MNRAGREPAEDLKRRIVAAFEEIGLKVLVLNRTNQLHFPQDDPLRRDVTEAYNHLHGLHIALHYMPCDRQKREESPTGNYELYRRKRKG